MLPLVFLGTIAPQPTTATFVLASWDYPDEYGQGIETIYYQIRWENDTVKEWGYTYPANVSQTFEVPSNGTVYLRLTSWVNGSLMGITNQADAQYYIRQDVNVTNLGVNVLTQQNFTYDGVAAAAPMYKVYHKLYLTGWHGSATTLMTNGFVGGQIYRAVINHEIFY